MKQTIVKYPKKRITAADDNAYREQQRQRRKDAKLKKLKAIASDSSLSTEEQLEQLFDFLVPTEGESQYAGGELVRAISKILYRDMNDGDVFYEGYGIETCGDAVAFLCDKIPELEQDFEDIAFRNFTGDNYTKALNDIAEIVVRKIVDDPEAALEPNKDDYLSYDGEKFIDEHEWEPKYELYFDYPDNIQYHLDQKDITLRELQNIIGEWEYCQNGDVNCERYGVSIYELSKDEYDELEYSMERWLEDFGNDLDNEYGSEEDEEYDDAHEYDEDEDEE